MTNGCRVARNMAAVLLKKEKTTILILLVNTNDALIQMLAFHLAFNIFNTEHGVSVQSNINQCGR